MRHTFAPALLPLALAGCSLVLDFDDVSGLRCPCDPNHVCLLAQDTCFPRRSVDVGKSCDLGAERPDDLCEEGAICERVHNQGLRCLYTCTLSTYATPETGTKIGNQCGPAQTCWESERGTGVCAEGVCNDTPNDCPPPQECERINGAGVCFTPCRIFELSACVGTQLCHPIAEAPLTACIPSGSRQLGEPCDDVDMCAQSDGRGRPLVCDRPAGATDMRRCRAICECPVGGVCDAAGCNTAAPCVIARPNVDRERMVGLGVCLE